MAWEPSRSERPRRTQYQKARDEEREDARRSRADDLARQIEAYLKQERERPPGIWQTNYGAPSQIFGYDSWRSSYDKWAEGFDRRHPDNGWWDDMFKQKRWPWDWGRG